MGKQTYLSLEIVADLGHEGLADVLVPVIDDAVGAQARQELDVLRGAAGRDVRGAQRFRELHAEDASAAGAAVDEDPGAFHLGFGAEGGDDRLVGREAADGDCGGVGGGEGVGEGDDVFGAAVWVNDELGGCKGKWSGCRCQR